MKVRAIATGYFGNRRIKPGQVFEIKDLKVVKTEIDPKTKNKVKKEVIIKAEEQFSDFWMERLGKDEAKATPVNVPKFDFGDDITEQGSKNEEPVI